MARSAVVTDTFYPIMLASVPPRVMTREDVDRYYRERGTFVKVLHLPAVASDKRDWGQR
jgi:hypothetical protein